jgi:hypothetical protein
MDLPALILCCFGHGALSSRPAGVTSITVKAWGGGGGGGGGGLSAGGSGGGGGFVQATLAVTPGETLDIHVGGGGAGGIGRAPAAAGDGGGGGGRSEVSRLGSPLIIAAGGGGGSGYYGGGGGGSQNLAGNSGGGGGGGSSYYTGTSTSTSAGSGVNAGNNTDPDYADNAGQGGSCPGATSNGTAGNTGRIVVTYSGACGSITLDNSASNACAGTNITSCAISNFNLGYGSGNNRLVVVGVTTEGQSDVTDVTFNSTSGTEVNPELDFNSMATISLWYFLDAGLPSSSANYDISATTSAVTNINIMVISVIDAAQQAQEDTGTNSCINCGAISASVTPATNGAWIFDAVHCGDDNYAGEELSPTGTGQTEPSGIELSNSTSSASMSYKELATAGNFSMAWDHTDATTIRMGDYAIAFAPASCGGGNQTPSDPTISDHNDGSTTSDSTPTLGFTQSDPDASEQVQYRIQIDDTNNTFSNLVVDYTSALMAEGATSFTVGQAAGSGTYTVGNAGQTLADGDYFWRVMTTDDESAASGWTQATSGSSVAFTVNTSGVAAYDQDSFRARNDNGSETASTWSAAADTDWTQMVDKNFRLRFQVQENAGVADTGKTFQLEYNRNGGGWNDVTGSSFVIKASATANVSDGVDTTQQLGSGTYIGTNAGFDETDGQVNHSLNRLLC